MNFFQTLLTDFWEFTISYNSDSIFLRYAIARRKNSVLRKLAGNLY